MRVESSASMDGLMLYGIGIGYRISGNFLVGFLDLCSSKNWRLSCSASTEWGHSLSVSDVEAILEVRMLLAFVGLVDKREYSLSSEVVVVMVGHD